MLSDTAAERAVLSGIFNYGSDAYIEIADIVSVDTFTLEANQVLYKCFQHVLGNESRLQKVDVPLMLSALSTLGLNEFINKSDNQKLLRAISTFPIEQETVLHLAKKLARLKIGRDLAARVSSWEDKLVQITGEESVDSILGIVEKDMFDFSSSISSNSSDETVLIGTGLEEYLDYLASSPVESVGIPSGMPKYDAAIGGGFRKKTVSLIGARPKVGKSTLSNVIAIFISLKLGIPVLYLDTEMSKEDQWHRMVANLSGVPIKEIETGKYKSDAAKVARIKAAAKLAKKIPYSYRSIAGKSFDEVLSIMRRWLKTSVGFEENGEAKPCLIIYDYFKLMSADGIAKNLQEYQVIGFQISALHDFMVRYGAACLGFVQLNRDGISKEDTDVASGSDRVVWICTSFSIFKPKAPEEMAQDAGVHADACNRKMVVIVTRHGPGMDYGDYINLKMDGSVSRIKEGKTRNEIYNVPQKPQPNGEFVTDVEPTERFGF